MEVSARRALVTGGAVRVGRAIALALARSGYDVALHYGRSELEARATRQDLISLGRRTCLLSADLSQAEAVAELVPRATAELGPLDVLINSAAIFLPGELDDTDLAAWIGQFAINLRAPFLLSQAFARQVPASGGNIVNICDARSARAGSDHFAYRLTKVGLEAMTRNLALDLAPSVRVNAVALGAILPPPGGDPEQLAALARERVPLQRPGSAELVADNVLHLLQQEFITGAVIPLDGGEFL